VHNEKNYDGYKCDETSHKYNQGKNLVMVVNKFLLLTYCPNFDKIKKGQCITSIPYNYVFIIDLIL
jgi:hypothetical protein